MEGILTPPFAAPAPRSRPYPGGRPPPLHPGGPAVAPGLPVAHLFRAGLGLTIPGAHQCKGGALWAIARHRGRGGSGQGRFRAGWVGSIDTRAGRSVPAYPVLRYARGGPIPPRFRPGLRYDSRSKGPGIAPGHHPGGIPGRRRLQSPPVHTFARLAGLQLAD